MVDAITQALLRRIADSIRILNANMGIHMKAVLTELSAIKGEIAQLKNQKK